MKKSIERFLQYISRNFFSCWIVLGVDTVIASLCTLFTFIGIHYITGIGWNVFQLLEVVAIAFLASIVGDLLFNLKSATPFPKCYLHKEKWTFDS